MTDLALYRQPRLSREVDLFWRDMRAAFPLASRARFERLMSDPDYQAAYQRGYDQGRREGAHQSLTAYARSIREMGAILIQGLDPRIAGPLVRGAVRVYTDPVGTPVPEELRARFEAARWYTLLNGALARAAPAMERLSQMSLAEGLDWVGAAVVQAMRQAGTDWVSAFYALNGQPTEQGRHAGRLIGAACAQVLIAALEDIATAGVGRLLDGSAAAGRIARIAESERPNLGPRPAQLEEAVADAARSHRPAKPRIGVDAALGPATALADDFMAFLDRLKNRLGDRLTRFTEFLDDGDWLTLSNRARALKNAREEVAARMLKGDITELMYPKTRHFADLFEELSKRVGKGTQWGDLVYDRAPRAHYKGANELVTDGVLYATSTGPGGKKIWIVAVFEAKSRTNARDLAKWPKDKGDAPWWAGQFVDDFERLDQVAITIGGKRFEPEQILVGKDPRVTEWVTVTAKDVHLSRKSTTDLGNQGFHPRMWNLPVTDSELNRLAEEVIRLLR